MSEGRGPHNRAGVGAGPEIGLYEWSADAVPLASRTSSPPRLLLSLQRLRGPIPLAEALTMAVGEEWEAGTPPRDTP